jgi:membrane protein implicated in regulation of membrane protease activity
MSAWQVWLAIAAVLGTAEILTPAFAAGLMASAAVVAAVVAGAGGGIGAQAIAFAATSFASLPVVLSLARRRGLAGARAYRTGVAALANRPAVVLTEVDGVAGTVRIGGEVWSARAYDETQTIPAGARVTVFEIDGATALVYPREFS